MAQTERVGIESGEEGVMRTTRTAACEGADTDIWFERTPTYSERAAQAICWGCTIRTDCLNFAVTLRIPNGIFGGLTPTQRDRYRRGAR